MDAAHHRKIELQAPEDLSYLVANVRRAAAAHVNQAFPPVDGARGGDDELRTRIEELVDEYIAKTFALAAPNLSINGLPVEPSQLLPTFGGAPGSSEGEEGDPARPEVVYEPFDARKRQRVEELTREEEDLLRDIALLKRGVPAAAAAAWAEAACRGVRDDEEALAAVSARLASPPGSGVAGEGGGAAEGVVGGGGGGSVLSEDDDVAGLLERQGDVERTYEGAVCGLGRLKREMPAVVARMERAKAAGEYVVTK
ncbi:hypothetical protein DL766_010269 [Monosporascus sp. MC13-8B]|uniref:Kinetochore protein mis14 n=1 Tax=Monosporascus cannonballus TaxID=155416 RepID=A0ABY0HC10_9PEZI|nr:hypothetical protein DL762_002918 [Monosporascus cannonballus]RYO97284.1 hypothetical protein DL763_002833 [Monosporascus cannonballus]RYP01864.1 hypothetical protein DL766_010269 [Monosporascus sp. MC13-8B]